MSDEHQFIGMWSQYFWEFMAVIVMPFLAFRATQWAKRTARKLWKIRIHWFALQSSTFAICWATAAYCLRHDYTAEIALWTGFVIAVFGSAVVEYVIVRSETASPALHAALTDDEMIVEDKTVMTTMIGLATGAKVKQDRRDPHAQDAYQGPDRRA